MRPGRLIISTGAAGTTVTGTTPGLTLSAIAGSVQADVDTNVTGTTPNLTLSGIAGSVQADVDTNVTGTTASLTLAAIAGTVTTGNNVSVTGTTPNLTLAAIQGSVQADVDTNVTGTTPDLTLTPIAGTVTASTPVSITGTTAELTLTAIPGSVSLGEKTYGGGVWFGSRESLRDERKRENEARRQQIESAFAPPVEVLDTPRKAVVSAVQREVKKRRVVVQEAPQVDWSTTYRYLDILAQRIEELPDDHDDELLLLLMAA